MIQTRLSICLWLAGALMFLSGCHWPNMIRPSDISPFTTDGCTGFPDGLPGKPAVWRHCCIQHDRRYWAGGTAEDRMAADRDLKECVIAEGAPDIAATMYLGVRFGGLPCWPTGYRWGYGWPYYRGYKPLSEEERAVVQKLAHEHQQDTEHSDCFDTQGN